MPTDTRSTGASTRPRGSRGSRGQKPPARRGTGRPRSRWAAVAAALLSLCLLAGAGVWAMTTRPWESVVVREDCTATANGASYSLTPEQAHYAAQISALSVKRKLPIRAATIATATAMQESNLKNLDYGDAAGPDSRGLFQQRPSQGWGTEAQIMTPSYAINAFYDALVKVSGYETMEITKAAQSVQRSALPDAYASKEPEARAFAAAFRGQTSASLSCTLRDAESPGSPEAVAQGLSEDFGVVGQTGASSVVVKPSDTAQGWAVAHWAVANASQDGIDTVTFAGRTWTRRGGWSDAVSSDSASAGTVQIVLHQGSSA